MRTPEPDRDPSVARDRYPLIGMAVHVRSLYNIGAMFRASDAANVSRLYLTGGCGHPGNQRERIDKTALGTIDDVPWTYRWEPLEALAELRAAGVRVVSLEMAPTSQPLSVVDRSWFPLALVVGHETDGVPGDVVAASDAVVHLRTHGRKPSLNVALAYGVAILRLADVWAAGDPAQTEG